MARTHKVGKTGRLISKLKWSSIEFRVISISTSGRDPRSENVKEHIETKKEDHNREWKRVRVREEEKESAKKIEKKGTRKAISYLGKSSPVSSL